MVELHGFKQQNIYCSEGFYVYSFKIRDQAGNQDVKVVSQKEIKSSFNLKIYGEWDKTRQQFICSDYCYSIDTDEELLNLLSYEVEECNPNLAKKILKAFGSETREKLKHPENIKSFFFLRGEEKARKLCESFRKKTHRNLAKINLIIKYGFSQDIATKISNLASEEEINRIASSNIYLFCEPPYSVSFRTIERIALKNGLKGIDSEERLKWHAVAVLEENELAGNLYMEMDEFIQKLKVSVNRNFNEPPYSDEGIGKIVNKLFEDKKVIRQVVGRVYLTKTELQEKMFAAEIVKRLRTSYDIDDSLLDDEINNYEAFEEINLADGQKEAIKLASKNQIMILTGGPGTGKTTVVKGIIAVLSKLFGYREEDIILVAPTGKAAKRMSESTGMKASTIHSAICIGEEDVEGKELQGKMVIIDESSMLDQRVAYALIKAIPPDAKIIFVGDINQLQSVGAGDVLNSMIISGIVPVVALSIVHRQQETSSIVSNANAINNGETKLVYDNDFSLIEVSNEQEALSKIVETYAEYAKKYGAENVALLCPRRRDTEVSVETLNPILQKTVNKNADSVTIGSNTFIVGDRVIQTKNAAVANGEIGIIVAIYKELTNDDNAVYRFKIDFSGQVVEYTESDMKAVDLAYATTVHKSQGSEYAHVIIPVLSSQYNMLKRNLLYTAVTRARKSVCLIGQKKSLNHAILNSDVAKRNTLLADRLVSYAKKIKAQ